MVAVVWVLGVGECCVWVGAVGVGAVGGVGVGVGECCGCVGGLGTWVFFWGGDVWFVWVCGCVGDVCVGTMASTLFILLRFTNFSFFSLLFFSR